LFLLFFLLLNSCIKEFSFQEYYEIKIDPGEFNLISITFMHL